MPGADALRSRLLWLLTITAALWLATSVAVLANRAWFELRNRRLILRTRSRRSLYQMIGRASTPDSVAAACALYVVERWGLNRIVHDAMADTRRAKWRRISALLTLAHLRHPSAHDLLAAAVETGQQDLCAAAVVGLGRLGDERAAGILADALRRNLYAPSRVATQLERFGIPIGDTLRPLLEDANASARYWGASLLRTVDYTAGIADTLATLTSDSDPSVRKAAIETLSRLSDPSVGKLARRRLSDSAPYVRTTAVRALGRRASAEDDEGRISIARAILPCLSDASWDVRNAAKQALTSVGPVAWKEVAGQLDSADAFARNGAAEVLQNIGLVDTLIDKVARREVSDPATVRLLSRALSAGGSVMVDAAMQRRAI